MVLVQGPLRWQLHGSIFGDNGRGSVGPYHAAAAVQGRARRQQRKCPFRQLGPARDGGQSIWHALIWRGAVAARGSDEEWWWHVDGLSSSRGRLSGPIDGLADFFNLITEAGI